MTGRRGISLTIQAIVFKPVKFFVILHTTRKNFTGLTLSIPFLFSENENGRLINQFESNLYIASCRIGIRAYLMGRCQ
jgi:hypothetical protein